MTDQIRTQAQTHEQETDEQELQARALSQAELDAVDGEELPDREAMSLINANLAIPINAAVSANVLSDGATAISDATQDAAMDQSA